MSQMQKALVSPKSKRFTPLTKTCYSHSKLKLMEKDEE